MHLVRRVSFVLALATGVAYAQPAPEQPAPEPPAPAPAPPETPPAPAPDQPVQGENTAPTEPATGEEIVVVGRVIDVLGKPVRGATVTLEGQTEPIGKTDRQGRFTVKAPMNATLVIESKAFGVGIATVTGRALDDTVLLTEKQLGETIEVKSDAPPPVAGAAKLDREELQRVPGTGGDVVRALTIMPGVVNLQIPLGYSGVVIRGSSPQDSKILIDDFEVPVLFHNIGFKAIVPSETIESLDFIPGGFDVAYGRATSGIVMMKTRKGSEKRSEQAEISVIDGGLLAQGPIGSKTRYMFALRRSTIDFVLPAIIPDSVDLSLTTVPRYYDGQLRIDHEINSHWNAMFSTIATDDTFELVGSKDENADSKRFFNRTRFARFTGAVNYNKGPWNVKMALSALVPQFVFEIGLYQYIRVNYPSVTPRFEATRTEAEAVGLKNVEWRIGAESQVTRSNVRLALPTEQREGDPNPVFDPKDTSTRVDQKIWTPDFTAWTSVAADFDPRFRVTVGARAEYNARPDEFLVMPRGEVKFKITKPWSLRLSSGFYSRPPEFQSEALFTSAKSEKSEQTIFGVQYEPREGARLQVSTYYNDRKDLLRNQIDDNGKVELVNIGRGKTVGAEVLGTYRGGPWFAWLSYSYSHSTRVDAPGEKERLFDYDQPHSMNAALSWKKGRWQLGGRFQLYSGLPNTPIIGSVYDSDRNIYIPVNGAVNSDRAPIHHQLDLRIDYSWHWGPAQMTAFLDVQNVYLNESVVTYFYSYDYSQRSAFKSIPIIPSIGLRGVL